MSAWIVSNRHIDYLVTALIAAELIPPSDATKIGRTLWRENLKSVAFRYPYDHSGTRPGPTRFEDRDVDEYEWQETPVLTGGALAKTVGCYDYQTCEHPTYKTSIAYRFVQDLGRISNKDHVDYPDDVPDDVPWGWPSR